MWQVSKITATSDGWSTFYTLLVTCYTDGEGYHIVDQHLYIASSELTSMSSTTS